MNTTESTTDQHLNEVALKQLTWKAGPLRDVACLIAEKVTVEPYTIWPDEIALASINSDDRNCVGSAWRLLTRAGVIKPTSDFRRSTAETSRGRKIFRYDLASMALARTFLRRNGRTPQSKQVEMFGQFTNN